MYPPLQSASMRISIKRLFAAAVAIGWMSTAAKPQSISTYVRTQAPEARIGVDAGQRASFRIPRTDTERFSKTSVIPSSAGRSEEHTSELQSLTNLVCRLLLENKKI